jgi:hypothetical protein
LRGSSHPRRAQIPLRWLQMVAVLLLLLLLPPPLLPLLPIRSAAWARLMARSHRCLARGQPLAGGGGARRRTLSPRLATNRPGIAATSMPMTRSA